MTLLTYLALILDSSIITISLPEEKIEKSFQSVLGYINNMSSKLTEMDEEHTAIL